MSWVTALRDFSWKPTPRTTIDFRKGDKYNMPKEAAEKLITEGKVRSSSKGKDNGGDTVDTATVDHAIEVSEGGENTPEEGSASSAGASSIGAAQGGSSVGAGSAGKGATTSGAAFSGSTGTGSGGTGGT